MIGKLIIQGKAWGEFESAKRSKGNIEISGYRSYGGTHTVRMVDQPQLNKNQQIVLKHLKSMCPPKLGVSAMVTVYCLVDDNINDNWQEYSEEIPPHIEALQKLNIAEENQVLQVFSQWVQEQEEE